MKAGIVGLPNVGKSTLFNCLSDNKAQSENFPFCTIDPNISIINVPDSRLYHLRKIVEPEKIIPTTVKIVDIAGLGNSYWNRGLLFKEMKQHDEAIKRLKESIKFQEELKDHRLEKHKKFLAEYEEELGKGK